MSFSISNTNRNYTSRILPIPLVQYITPDTDTINWNNLNNDSYFPSILLNGYLTAPKTLYLGKGIDLWNKLFGSKQIPYEESIFTGNVIITNNTGQSITFVPTSSNPLYIQTGNFNGNPFPTISIKNKELLVLQVKFSSKTDTGAIAQIIPTKLEYTN